MQICQSQGEDFFPRRVNRLALVRTNHCWPSSAPDRLIVSGLQSIVRRQIDAREGLEEIEESQPPAPSEVMLLLLCHGRTVQDQESRRGMKGAIRIL